ncbi:MAG: phytoene/squalene synthase family protein [Proteobacteria bacterium]|nr:phytoene/squalene synthase family protein [Pseudomonadota bacterium]
MPGTEGQLASSADWAACRALIRQGSKTFFASSRLLPERLRSPALGLYAFCRVADDAVDEGGDPAALEELHARLERVYAGAPRDGAVDRAFAQVVAEFAIPRALPEALLEGFAWDLAGRRYRTLDELCAYAARVAGSVGAMMACLMSVRSASLLARACELGVAMQLTNIARDVGGDARAGRLYLPLEWMADAGLDPDCWLREPVACARLRGVVARLLESAAGLYGRAGTGIERLPGDCRWGIRAAAGLYAAIGDAVARNDFDSVSRRAVVPAWRKTALLLRAGRPVPGDGAVAEAPGLAVTDFLVRAAALTGSGAAVRPRQPRIDWLLGLFERLERERLGLP